MPYYYEILVHTLDQDKVVRRVPTRRDAERVIAELIHSDMVSRSAIRWERRCGLDPWSMRILCGGLTLLTLLGAIRVAAHRAVPGLAGAHGWFRNLWMEVDRRRN